jgi:DNA-binding transcriptional regulator YdaS (Cro superfamily)
MREDALIKACKIAGSRVELAKDLAISATTLSNWVNAGVRVPLEIAMDIEVKVDGQVIAENISPNTAVRLKRYKNFLKIQWLERVRKITYEFLNNEHLIKAEEKFKLPLRSVFLGLLSCCDHDWRFRWQPYQLKMNIMPNNAEIDFERALNALFLAGFITKKQVKGECYGFFTCLQT